MLRVYCANGERRMPGADFPNAFRVNLWARGLSQDKSAEEALSDFKVDCFIDSARSIILCHHIHGLFYPRQDQPTH